MVKILRVLEKVSNKKLLLNITAVAKSGNGRVPLRFAHIYSDTNEVMDNNFLQYNITSIYGGRITGDGKILQCRECKSNLGRFINHLCEFMILDDFCNFVIIGE